MPPFDQCLAELRAAAEPTRLRLLWLLSHGELTVTEATKILGQAQPGVSRHLRLLCEAGLVERHQEGAWVFYGSQMREPLLAVVASLKGEAVRADAAGLARVRAKRTALAGRYFAEHAADWDSPRRRHLADAAIEAALLEMAGPGTSRLIDLGTGTGRMLTLFSGRYETATGFDASPEMLAVARVRLAEAGAVRARVRRGDILDLGAEPASADLVVLHHVLHFVADPARAVAAAARLLREQGRVLVADLAPHDREVLRERHAHRRLGFSDREVAATARRSGLVVAATRTIPPPGPDGLTAKIWRLERAADQGAARDLAA